jgi:hypothetical protein
MKITEFGSVKNINPARRREKTSQVSSSFADFLDVSATDETTSTPQLSDVASTSSVSNMLALQEISEAEVERKRLIQKGKNILDVLENLRHQLLIGEVPLSTLQSLGRQLSVQRQSISDPHLLALLDDIELRAAVELAKLEMAAAAASPAPYPDDEK